MQIGLSEIDYFEQPLKWDIKYQRELSENLNFRMSYFTKICNDWI